MEGKKLREEEPNEENVWKEGKKQRVCNKRRQEITEDKIAERKKGKKKRRKKVKRKIC